MSDAEVESLIRFRAYDRVALERAVSRYLRRANWSLAEIACVIGRERQTVNRRLKK